MTAISMRVLRLLALCGLIAVAGCASTYQNHGYVPPESDLEKLVVGVDTRATVDDTIGPPSVSGLVGDGDYYYVRSRKRTYMMLRPKVVEREVVAISFNDDNTIANIEKFGLEAGKAVPISRRVTDSSVVDNGFLRQIIKNIGVLNPEQIFGQ
ncbi:outer membrane protein assembly factor BamE [Roseovarius ramblicola]|uniref:Outer membrane protein assembly factor BamE n=1 Tax=Roseovarius ramblicola TaxID=2022336 RepID=A0ABV5I170_9RHOB